MKKSLLTAIAGWLVLCGQMAAQPAFPTLSLGASAHDFELPGVDGRTYSLASFAKAKVLVVIFTCNHCPTAQYYEPRIKQLAADYGSKGVTLCLIRY